MTPNLSGRETCDRGLDVHRDIQPMSLHMSRSVSPFPAKHNPIQKVSGQLADDDTFSLAQGAFLGCQNYREISNIFSSTISS